MVESNDKLDIERLVAFWSIEADEAPEQVKNAATEWSDIELAIVSPDFSTDRFEERLNLMRLAARIDDRIEPNPYTPEDFDANDPLASEIKRTGVRVA